MRRDSNGEDIRNVAARRVVTIHARFPTAVIDGGAIAAVMSPSVTSRRVRSGSFEGKFCMKRLSIAFSILVSVLLLPALASAQATVAGTVRDTSGAVLP